MASLLQQLVKQGHEMLVFTLEKHPQLEPAADPASKPIRFVTLDSSFLAVYPTKRLAMPTLTNMNLICNTIRLEGPDVLHCTLDCISAFFILAAKFYHVPVVGSVHTDVQELLAELNVAPIAGSLITFKEGVESRLLDSCATTSPSFKSKLAGRGVVCDHIIKTGVTVGQFRPGVSNAEVRNRLTFGNPEGLLVVYVGRFGPEKRLDKLVQMCGSVDGVYLALIGDGAMGPALSERHGCWSNSGKRRTKGGVYCRIGFLGHEDLAPVYASADVHVSCSHFETLGNTVLEAHASGTAVVVPRAQGFIDTVNHEEDGFLFDGHRLAEGAAFLARLRDDRDLCASMGERGRQKVQMQSPEMVSKHVLEWYRRARASTKGQKITTSLATVAAEQLSSLVKVLMGVGICLLILLVVALWFAVEAVQVLGGSVVRYCHNARNVLGNSSFFNKVSNSYKALTNITVEREATR
ncbi:GT4 [Ectocarpus sp. CCAP 1310/34]|nr:GT4 [Ectocarpus sp. CCAP 1310/34]